MAKFPKTPFEACLGDFPKHLKNDQKGGLLGRGWKSEGEVPSKSPQKGQKRGVVCARNFSQMCEFRLVKRVDVEKTITCFCWFEAN